VAWQIEHKAINLGQGFPDYQMNEELMNKVSETEINKADSP
jgi:hypothetical protein